MRYLFITSASNASYVAINEAQEMVRQTGDLSVPILRNAPTKLMKELATERICLFTSNPENELHKQEFLPKEISNTALQTLLNQREEELKRFLAQVWKGKYGY